MDKILLVVDMQNDFVTGSLGSKEAEAMVSNAIKKISEFIFLMTRRLNRLISL